MSLRRLAPGAESPTNPYLRCVDVPRIAALCHAHGALVCIDSTFATPINQRAIALGADLVLHSATKYLAGHNDVMAGQHPDPCLVPEGSAPRTYSCPGSAESCKASPVDVDVEASAF